MRKLKIISLLLICVFCLTCCNVLEKRTAIKVLILPKFEVGEMSADFPGEAQYFYEGFLNGSKEYDIAGDQDHKLYVKDEVALALTGEGKVNSALTVMSILTDDRFDFSDAYVLSVGCAGSARDTTVMGDVFVISAAVDYDYGHHVDIRELQDENSATWFHDDFYDDAAYIQLNPVLIDRMFELVKDIPLKTTKETKNYMSAAFDGADWAIRDPRVLRGTTVSSDNYWKGEFDHKNALLMIETYQCSDPYVTTEMEDVAIAAALKRLGMLERLIILRTSVNMDVFMLDNTPESLWDPDFSSSLASEYSMEAVDIFPVAMENLFTVGRKIIEAIQNNELNIY